MDREITIRRRSRSRDYPWMSEPEVYFRAVTPAAIAGRARSARAKQARHDKKWGLLAPVVEPPPPEPSIEERTARFNENAVASIRQRRERAADDWLRARARLRELPRERAAELMAEWNARTWHGNAWGVDLLVFLDERAPTPERIAERREARLSTARGHRRAAEKAHTYWIEHVDCPEIGCGVVEIQRLPVRRLTCIACGSQWGKADLQRVEEQGILRVIDCRLAVQEELDLT
jgi:hypothetical protein